MTVGKLRRLLLDYVNKVSDYDDDKEVHMVSNTYFLGHPYCFLGISGYDGGYINLDNPVKEDEEDED